MTNKTCSTCYWWLPPLDERSNMRVCVLHTGLLDSAVRRVDFGGRKPLMTVATFGCNEWKRDEREVAE